MSKGELNSSNEKYHRVGKGMMCNMPNRMSKHGVWLTRVGPHRGAYLVWRDVKQHRWMGMILAVVAYQLLHCSLSWATITQPFKK